ncbi:ImmA/IrrE family metallo-endopeptidase [Phytohabitans suffuscus]|uniref:IrrE N-terminal-like domain-containing protein n=1 Tax=Phytohabitans suffuscus TaxID=624315 RepID=A0A6F8YDD7_9ACTN|nr:ImmA/IrrE family metallo-endopeptidase [Phytohabitans suffuscus]BCB84116.1 hypothetical protein Psuf_014290 [Phytohabitans suffuscus]
MRKPNKTEMQALVRELRAIAPKRPLTYGESLQVGRIQAARLRRWANAVEPDINLIWLVKQRLIPVNFVASHKLGEESGLTTDQVSGRLEMFVNEGEPPVRQRFSLLHEWKHALDFDDAPILHAKLGRGNAKVQAGQIEAICNDFAAHVLMPTALVKREWFTWQELSVVANIFNVSVEAIATRLEKLGILGEPKPAPRFYFRRSLLPDVQQDDFALAA